MSDFPAELAEISDRITAGILEHDRPQMKATAREAIARLRQSPGFDCTRLAPGELVMLLRVARLAGLKDEITQAFDALAQNLTGLVDDSLSLLAGINEQFVAHEAKLRAVKKLKRRVDKVHDRLSRSGARRDAQLELTELFGRITARIDVPAATRRAILEIMEQDSPALAEACAQCFDDIFLSGGLSTGHAGPGDTGPDMLAGMPADLPPDIPLCIVQGLGYSGSGAVFDCLRAHYGFDEFLNRTRFVSGSSDSSRTGDSLLSLIDSFENDTDDAFVLCLRRFVIRWVLGFRYDARFAHLTPVSRHRSLTANCKSTEAMATLFTMTARFTRGVAAARAQRDPARFGREIRGFFSGTLRALFGITGDRPVVVNQFMKLGYTAFDHFPGSVLVLVTRDPRDRYADLVLAGNIDGRQEGVEAYCRDYEKLLEDALGFAKGRENCLLVTFETFVSGTDAERRIIGEIGRILGTGIERRAEGSDLFDREKSQRNVGIHRRVLDRELADGIAAYFADRPHLQEALDA